MALSVHSSIQTTLGPIELYCLINKPFTALVGDLKFECPTGFKDQGFVAVYDVFTEDKNRIRLTKECLIMCQPLNGFKKIKQLKVDDWIMESPILNIEYAGVEKVYACEARELICNNFKVSTFN